ncbi:MAG: hypothetical protein WCO36_08715 [Actinomycetes bacterium]
MITSSPEQSTSNPSASLISSSGPLATVVAACLAGAGLIHLAFAPGHLETSATHGAFFVAVAWLQLVLAGLIVTRRGGRATLFATVAVQAVVIGVWVVSRTSGIDGVVEPVGLADALASAFAVVAVAGSALLLLGWHGPRVRGFVGGVATTLSALVVMTLVTMSVSPALGGGHVHSGSEADGHSHVAGSTHDHSSASGVSGQALANDGHDHSTDAGASGATGAEALPAGVSGATTAAATHAHGPASPTPPPTDGTPTTTTPSTPSGPIISFSDPRLTADQRARGQALLDASTAGMAQYNGLVGRLPLKAALNANGYTSIGDSGTGFEHYVNSAYLGDGIELDANKVESVVLQRQPDSSWVLGSAMYILNNGKTMADVPEIAGAFTTWHDHQNLCWEGLQVVGLLVNGTCTRGTFRPTAPMLHVWMTPQACGPFTGIEGFGGTCVHSH